MRSSKDREERRWLRVANNLRVSWSHFAAIPAVGERDEADEEAWDEGECRLARLPALPGESATSIMCPKELGGAAVSIIVLFFLLLLFPALLILPRPVCQRLRDDPTADDDDDGAVPDKVEGGFVASLLCC